MSRENSLRQLAEVLDGLRRPHPVRVAIDGVGASGKTVLADELAALLEGARPVIRASIDGFHRPKAQRYERGGNSPQGYLDDSFDYGAVEENLLAPLGPGGDLRYRTAVFDFRTESPVESPVLTARPDAVLIFDGVFLLRRELERYWDFAVFVDAGFDVTLDRALTRDLALFGSADAVRERYEARYIPGERMYLKRHAPRERADVVMMNDDPANASLRWRELGDEPCHRPDARQEVHQEVHRPRAGGRGR